MMYKEKFVAVVKCSGAILREIDDAVTLPFGSEYFILLKNLESRKASVKVYVDGEVIPSLGSLIVNGNSELELKGFLKDGLVAKNGFKFIQKTREIIEHRGDKIDDGLIRVEFTFEKKVVTEKRIVHEDHYDHHHHHDYYHDHWYPHWHGGQYWINYNSPIITSTGSYGGSSLNNLTPQSSQQGQGEGSTYSCAAGSSELSSRNISANLNEVQCNYVNEVPTPLPDEGITVPGSIVNQQFQYGYIGELEESSNVIIIKLRGITSVGSPVQKPIEVRTRVQCPTCGRRSRSNAKFCSKCGTSLV